MARQPPKLEKLRGDQFSELRVDEAISNKSWAARKHGYEAVANIFKNLEPRSPHWDRLSPLLKGISEERNVPALEKGLEAALMFVQMCGVMKDETVTDLLNEIIIRCLADQKMRIRELATNICMMLFEKRKHELVLMVLLERLEGRNAKQSFACIRTLTSALILYGPTIVDVSLITPRIASLCVNKSLFQQEVKDLLREIYAIMGPGIREHLTPLDSSQLRTLEIEFTKVDKTKAERSNAAKIMETDRQPTKNHSAARPKSTKSLKSQPISSSLYHRPASSTSQTVKQDTERIKSPTTERLNRNTSSAKPGKKKEEKGACGDRFSPRSRVRGSVQPQIGLDDIFSMIESKQWGDRKDALDELLKVINSDEEISATAYNKVIKSLRILILNDTNVLLISKAVQCVTALAKKEDQEFRQHAPLMVTLLLEKFKEKKTVLVDAIREATDAIYSTCCFASIVRYIGLSLEHQNPAVKSETELFVWRCFSNPSSEILKTIYWHQLVGNLVKNLTFPDQNVRTNATKALGAMMKAVGDHILSPHLKNVQNHHMNMIIKFRDEAIVEFRQPNSSIGNDSSDQSIGAANEFDEDRNKGTVDSKKPGTTTVRGHSKVNGAKELPRYSSDEYEMSSNSQFTDERLYDAQELNASDGPKRRSASPSTLIEALCAKELQQRVDATKSPKSKSFKFREDENRMGRPTIVSDSGADAQESRNGSSKKTLRRKPLSPAAQQKLNSLRSTIEQLRSKWSDVENPLLPNNSAKRNAEREIAKLLETLESNVGSCFKEIRQLSPLLYGEINEPESPTCGSPTVLREFNKRLVRMEGLLKSMTFDENVNTGAGNVKVAPAVIRQGNGNWFVEGGY